MWCYMRGEEVDTCAGTFGNTKCKYAIGGYCHIQEQMPPIERGKKGQEPSEVEVSTSHKVDAVDKRPSG